MHIKETLKLICPPILIKIFAFIYRNEIQFSGNYLSWKEAEKKASGYDDNSILKRVREASLKVRNGEAVFERDSVCFYVEEYRWPVLTSLIAVAANNNGNLNVLDFGGALGSFYFQHKKILNFLKSVRWSVIEQPHFVECGKSEFQNNNLKFYSTIEECITTEKVNVVLLSSVLQYIESPHALLAKLAETQATYIIIDRTPIHAGTRDKLTIQTVPDSIFTATLPAYIFSENNIDLTLAKLGYEKVISFPSIEKQLGEINFIGILYSKETK